jgi:hypothetical protein
MNDMKKILVLLFICVFASVAFAGQPTVRPYGLRLKDEGAAHGTPPSGYLDIYVNGDTFYSINDAGTATALATGSGDNTLDNAYDQGGAGSGKAITADSGAVAISNTDADTAWLFTLNASPSSAAALGGAQITVGANSTQDALEFANSGSGYDIYGTSGAWTVSKAGAATFSSVTATSFTGAFSPTTLAVGGATSIEGNLTLDDGSGASPSLVFTDASDETATFSKANSGNISITTLAADGFQVLTGNLRVGNGSPGTASMDGEDAYIEGELEVDGAVQLDGALTAASTIAVSGGATFANTVSLSENVTFTMAADEYLQLDASTTDMTQTAGALDINFDSVTNGAEGINVKANLVAGGGGSEVVSAAVLDLDDDSDAAGTLIGLDINSSDATGSSAIYGIRLGNALEQGLNITNAAAAQSIVIDATTAAQTGTSGSVADIAFRTATDTAQAINLDIESDLTGAGEKAYGFYVQMDDDSANADNELHAIHINTDANGTGLQHAIYVGGTAGIDAALYAANGYLRVGTGSTPDQALGDDDSFMEGHLEVDGNIYPDGNIVGDGATELVGVRHDTVVSAGATVAVTAAESGTVFFNDQATEFDLPADPTGLEFTFCVDNASNLVIDPNGTDRIWGATDANGDSLTSSTVGDCVTLVGTDADTWFVKSAYPAATDWPDTN